MRRTVGVTLTTDEHDFIDRLSKHEQVSFNEEMARIFHAGLEQVMESEANRELMVVRDLSEYEKEIRTMFMVCGAEWGFDENVAMICRWKDEGKINMGEYKELGQ